MALRKEEAWITYAVDDSSVTSALVLAKSLKRVGTTRRIVVVTNGKVSLESRATLRKSFHAVFNADEVNILLPDSTDKINVLKKELQASCKLFAISLDLFEKCVFLSPNFLALENVDTLFDVDVGKGMSCRGRTNDIFVYRPSRQLCQFLDATTNSKNNRNVSYANLLNGWFENQVETQIVEADNGAFPDQMVGSFSMETGYLTEDNLFPAIIHFEQNFDNGNVFDKMSALLALSKYEELGRVEQLIVSTWMELFNQETEHAQISDDNSFKNEPIAIIGMSCRYPGANNLEEFWNQLFAGDEGICKVPSFRWRREQTVRVAQQDRHTDAGFLKDPVDEFDARFFGVSPKEAAYLDPQIRLLHEVVWESLEDGGVDPHSLHGSHTGIFTGSWMNDYGEIVRSSPDYDFFRTYMGNSIGAAAARLSFLFGLTGPSIATESGCSSAIVALDLAVKSLRSGETNLAVAGGVNLMLKPFTSSVMEYVISPDGRCKTFDEKADGFARAEGCGVMVLKRLSDALRDRDNIWSIIRGSAVSQEGLSKSLGTPTVHCETLAMKMALKDANISPRKISFVESHGTGTAVGDPMEMAAIAEAYGCEGRPSPLVIGSVKTNVGHTESCSGITGIMKAILAMEHELIPKHRNLTTLNPEIKLDAIPAMIPLEAVPWPKIEGQPRFAGVSSFGITGTDGHVILQEKPETGLPKLNLGLERPLHLMRISGKTQEALEDLLQSYQKLFAERKGSDDRFSDAAHTTNVGRANFSHQVFITARNYEQAAQVIEAGKFTARGEMRQERGNICFLFTGQGSQYAGMAKSLYESSPIFKVHFDLCDRELKKVYNLSLRPILWNDDNSAKSQLSRTIYSQTSIFCVEYCLLRLWQSWGIKPDYVLGHSLGEFCAAVAANILTFKDALKLVAERSRLTDNLPRGSMLVIKADVGQVEKLMKAAQITDLDFAAVNNTEQTVVAGDTNKIEKFKEYLKGEGVKCVILEATHAFHSRHMDPMLEKYRKIAETVRSMAESNGDVKYISGMEGKLVEDLSNINADYWVRHTREKVNFVEACKVLRKLDVQDYLEVGPQPVLSSFVTMNNDDVQMNCIPSLRKGQSDWDTMLGSLAKLHLHGYSIDWNGYDEPYLRKKVKLPFHPFHRKSFWVEPTGNNCQLLHPLVGYALPNASILNIFQNDLTLKSVPYLKDHCIGSRVVFPGAGYTEICLAAGHCVASGLTENLEMPRRALRIQDLKIDAPLELTEDKSCRLQVIVDLPESSGDHREQHQGQGFRVKIFHQRNTTTEEEGCSSGDKWIQHASSHFVAVPSTKDAIQKWKPNRVTEIMKDNEEMSTDGFYRRVDDAGLKFGKTFKAITKYWCVKQRENVDEVVAEMEIPKDSKKYLLHPLIIDAMFQARILTKFRYENSTTKLNVPVHIGQLTLFSCLDEMPSETILYMHSWLEDDKYNVFVGSSSADNTLTPIALMEDVELIETNVRTIESVLELQTSSVPEAWEEQWRVIPGPYSNIVELTSLEPVFSDKDFLRQIDHVRNTAPADEKEQEEKLERVIYLYILNVLYELDWRPQINQVVTVAEICENLKILPKFSQLVHFYFTVLEAEDKIMEYNVASKKWRVCRRIPMSHDLVKDEMNQLHAYFNSSRVTAGMTVVANSCSYISKSYSKILTGDMSPLSILFPSDPKEQIYSADSLYQNGNCKRYIMSSITILLQTLSSKLKEVNQSNTGNPVIRVLEIGSGTGALSSHVLNCLKDSWGNHFEFYFTDISQSFFVKAEKKLEEYKNNIKYALFNIEQSPLDQGIPLNYFDVVVAFDVLHATRNLQESLVHLRQTMKPKGILCVNETLIQDSPITYVFGVLEGYWRFQDFHRRPYHCCVGEDTWHEVLSLSGFTSTHVSKIYMDKLGCICAEAADIDMKSLCNLQLEKSMDEENEITRWLVFAPSQDSPITSQLSVSLQSYGYVITTIVKGEVEMKLVESILDDDKIAGIVYAWGLDSLEKEQKAVAYPFMTITQKLVTLKRAPKLYVLTSGVHPVVCDIPTCNPTAATLFGMIKSLKNEFTDMFVRYIDLDSSSDACQTLTQILFEMSNCKGNKLQVAYRNSQRYEPRLIRSPKGDLHGDELSLPSGTDRYKLVLPSTRAFQDLKFEPLEIEEVGADHVEVRVMAYALNFRDIFAILKPSAAFEKINTVGLDFSGVVTKAGPLSSRKVGDRVFGAYFEENQLHSHLIVPTKFLLRVPDKMTCWEASTIPAVTFTAYHCLITVAKLKQGETILIHTGSGGVGLAAIQVAKHVGATIITTAGNPRKRAYLKSLGIEHVFHSRNTSYEADILRVTNGRGVDVVLNSITGPGFKEATLNASAKNSRFIEMSKLSIWTCEEVKILRPDVDYSIVDLTYLEEHEWKPLMANVSELLENGSLTSLPFVKFDALNVRKALQYLQKAKHIGKVVCTMPEVTTENGKFTVQPSLFSKNYTYLITGGLGGIGFEVCKWMLEKGATDIVLIGRSAPNPKIAKEIEHINNEKSYNVTVQLADVGDFDQCKRVIDMISNSGRPLRGIQHCAGVIRDNLYGNQTWEAFEATFKPKVSGSWNLHWLTKDLPLEHFVLYSSITAMVGTVGQANHAAANCFEDSFAHYRHSRGLPALSINWGQWAQVGCAKEISLSGILPVSMKRMLNGLEVALRNAKTQVSFGDYDSFHKLSMLCPIVKYYLDERLLEEAKAGSSSCLKGLSTEQIWKELAEAVEKQDKVAVLCTYLKTIVRSALRLDADEAINENANIQDLGVDSLMMIELKNSIQTLLGSRISVSANMLKNCSTISDLAAVIINKVVNEDDDDDEEAIKSVQTLQPEEFLQLLTKDSHLDESIRPATGEENAPAKRSSEMKSILLTGATGQLGPFILAEICKSYKSVERITCIVRTKENASPDDRLKNTLRSMNMSSKVDYDKVVCISGNLSRPKFGLGDQEYDELCHNTDAIIHCAVKSNHIEAYREVSDGKGTDIRSANVEGTLNILKFAVEGKTKRLFYASTLICIMSENEEGTLSDAWPKDEEMKILADYGIPGYYTSKCVSELLIRQANERGVPSKVFRLPYITGDSETGEINWKSNHLILRLMTYLKLKVMPSMPIAANVLPADICAQTCLKVFFDDEAPCEVYNISCSHPQVEQEFVNLARQEFGTEVGLVELSEFGQMLQNTETPLEGLKGIYKDFEFILKVLASDAFPGNKGYIINPERFFENPKIAKYLPELYNYKPTSMEILLKDLNFVRSQGAFEKFGI